MEQIRSRAAIREEGAQAAREGKPFDACPSIYGDEAALEWKAGYLHAQTRAGREELRTQQGRQLAAMLERADRVAA